MTVQRIRLKSALLACVVGTGLLASPAFAQEQGSTIDPRLLVEQLVAEGILKPEQAARMLRNATVQAAAAPAPAAAPVVQGGVQPDGSQVVAYVPPVVREQIVAQVRQELSGEAQAQGWAKPGETPEWTRRIQVYGDVRMRGEARFYDKGNGDIFTNYGAINHGDPQNINTSTPRIVAPAFLNTLEDRQRFRVRARLGVRAQVDDWITADIRIATGADNSPVSTNQTLGADSGTGKYQIWLDRAAIRLTPVKDLNIDLGRFANPFWTSDLIYDWDMNFDGIAVSGKAAVSDRLSFFGAAGAFPVFNTDLNFGSRNAPKIPTEAEGADPYPGIRGSYKSQDKYLLAVQAGVDFKATDAIGVRLAGAYFHYANVAGKVSAPCNFDEVTCSTDATRPAFQQYGNTMFPIRDVIPDPLNPVTSPENQYFGLASDFRILNVRGAIDFQASDSLAVRLEGDYVRNLGWKRGRVAARAINNLGAQTTAPDPANNTGTITVDGPYAGGNDGWQARLTLGSVLNLNWYGDWSAKPGDWNVYAAYRRLESDAVIDAFSDSDMHIGGTNHRGWFVGGNYAIGRNTVMGARWLTAEEVVDAPFSVDRLFVDVMTRF